MRTGPTPARAGHDRWLMSYADLVTLLFAFFTVLYAAAQVQQPAVAAQAAAPVERPEPNVSPDAARDAQARVVVEALRARMAEALDDDVRGLRAEISRDGRGLVVSLPEEATFLPGSADVTAEARPLVRRVVEAIGDRDYAVRVEGHTDDRPIRTSRFPSNWELSTARAGAVVAFMVDTLGVPPERLSAAGYGEFHPRTTNASTEGRARNRRIDIVILDGAPTP